MMTCSGQCAVRSSRVWYESMPSRKELGQIGEEAAVRALLRRGYRIRDRNVRCPMGELDLVAEDDGTLVFLEVNTGSRSDYVSPFEAISPFNQYGLQRLTFYS